ncbi:hypothetical protein AB5I41_05820 [Sphingomonas sp. MMS24-JH45]
MSAEAIAARLTALGLGEVAGATLLTGGASMETWAFEAGGQPLILRTSRHRAGGRPSRVASRRWRARRR